MNPFRSVSSRPLPCLSRIPGGVNLYVERVRGQGEAASLIFIKSSGCVEAEVEVEVSD